MKIIGMTGSSGSGKSLICKMLKENYNVELIDADKIARKLSKKGTMYFNKIIENFGQDVIYRNGVLNRKKLADLISEDEEKRKILNNCTWGYIISEIKQKINKPNHKNVIVIDAPLLFESNLNTICDITVAVISERELQIQRICERDKITKEQAEKRLNMQASNEYFKENVDYVIENISNKTLEEKLQDSGLLKEIK